MAKTVMQELSSDIKEIKKWLLGNGQKGYLEMTRENSERIYKLESDRFGKWLVRIGVAFSGIMSTALAVKQFLM